MGHGVSRRGAAKVEYALMLLVVTLSCMFFAALLGQGLSDVYDSKRAPVGVRSGDAPVTTTAPDQSAGGDKNKPHSRRGNPGQGNAGNDKTVGNAPGAGEQRTEQNTKSH